jgi:WD40 repeat protein
MKTKHLLDICTIDLISSKCKQYLFGIERQCIFKYNIETRTKTTISGSVHTKGFINGTCDKSLFNNPQSLALSYSTLYVADCDNNHIRQIDIFTGIVTDFKKISNECVRISPDLKLLYVTSRYKLVILNIQNGNIITTISMHRMLSDIAFSPDGKNIFVSSLNGDVYNINNDTHDFEHIVQGRDGDLFICYLSISPNCQMVYFSTAEKDGFERFDIVTRELKHDWWYDSDFFRAISPDNKTMYLSGNKLGYINILDINKFKQSQIFKFSNLSKHVISML